MNADVSRALARFAAAAALSRDGARELAAQFADIGGVADLPDWVREGDDDATLTAHDVTRQGPK